MTNKNTVYFPGAEFTTHLGTDPEYIERRRKQEEESAEHATRFKKESAPIMQEILALGLNVEDLSSQDLCYKWKPFPDEVFDIMLKHLAFPYDDIVRSTIASKLAVKHKKVQKAWSYLVEQYKTAPQGMGIRLKGDKKEYSFDTKYSLASVLDKAVTEKTLPELIELIKDKSHGESRGLMLSSLKKRRKKDPAIAALLEELVKDPDLTIEISSWKK